MKYLCLLAAGLLPIISVGQIPVPDYLVPPAVAPASCALPLASLETLVGPQAYRRLESELKALESAQNSVSALKEAIDGLSNEKSPTLALSAMFTGTQRANSALLCSASLVAKYRPVDENDGTVRTLLIAVYNQEAAAITSLEEDIKEQFLRSETERNQATMVKDAERITAITSLQGEAANTLLEATTVSLLMSVDSSNPKATDTKQTVLPCRQYAELQNESMRISQQTKSAYTSAASLFVNFLIGHKCR